MSTGISIVSASYGAGSSTTDVTNTVVALVKDGALRFTVTPNTLNVSDPAPGQVKTLTLTYTVNGGSNNTLTTKDNDSVNIDAPPATLASGLQIEKAEYGYAGNYTDVTDAIQNLVGNGEINIKKISPAAVGVPDPNPRKQKELKIEYTLNGKKSSETIKDGASFKLSAPAVEAVSNKKPKDSVTDSVFMLFRNIALFFGVFLYVLSIGVGFHYGGDSSFKSYLTAGACFFLPGFAFWGLPIITFFMRLFSSGDVFTLPATVAVPNIVPKMVSSVVNAASSAFTSNDASRLQDRQWSRNTS